MCNCVDLCRSKFILQSHRTVLYLLCAFLDCNSSYTRSYVRRGKYNGIDFQLFGEAVPLLETGGRYVVSSA